jgi:hypothetical protein
MYSGKDFPKATAPAIGKAVPNPARVTNRLHAADKIRSAN